MCVCVLACVCVHVYVFQILNRKSFIIGIMKRSVCLADLKEWFLYVYVSIRVVFVQSRHLALPLQTCEAAVCAQVSECEEEGLNALGLSVGFNKKLTYQKSKQRKTALNESVKKRTGIFML